MIDTWKLFLIIVDNTVDSVLKTIMFLNEREGGVTHAQPRPPRGRTTDGRLASPRSKKTSSRQHAKFGVSKNSAGQIGRTRYSRNPGISSNVEMPLSARSSSGFWISRASSRTFLAFDIFPAGIHDTGAWFIARALVQLASGPLNIACAPFPDRTRTLARRVLFSYTALPAPPAVPLPAERK